MSAEPIRCPRCNGEMVQGFIFEYDGATRKASAWVEGPPEKTGFWVWGGVKVPADKCVPVGTFRCAGCGLLESYARPEFAPH